MTAEMDLSEPAVKRNDSAGSELRSSRHLLRRFVLPALLPLGFLVLAAWATVDFVVSSYTAPSELLQEGTPHFKATGRVEPRPTPVPVAALVGGVVDKLLVVEDQPVKAGEAVAELVKEDARHAYERALAELKLREAELEEAQAGLTAATARLEKPVHLEVPLAEAEAALAKIETQLKELPFEIRRAEARLDFAKRDCQGKTALKGVVAGRAIDQARSALAEATASLEESQARKDSLRKEREARAAHRDILKTQLELRVGEIQAKREAEAKLKAAQARVKQAEIHLAEAKLQMERGSTLDT